MFRFLSIFNPWKFRVEFCLIAFYETKKTSILITSVEEWTVTTSGILGNWDG